MKGFAIIVVLLIVAFVVFGLQPDTKRATELAGFCKSNPAEVKKVFDSWVKNGVIKGRKGDDIIVEDAAWDNAPHNAKVSIGLAVYCQAFGTNNPPTGTVHMWGYRDGKIKASVADGSYFD